MITTECAYQLRKSGLTVDVTTTSNTVFLGLIGVNSMTVHGSAKVSLVHGVSGALP